MNPRHLLRLPEFGPGEATEHLRAAFERDGCVLIRGLLPRAVVDAARQPLLDGLTALVTPAHTLDEQSAGYARLSRADILDDLPRAAGLAALVMQLVGGRCFCLPTRVLRVIPPERVRTPYGRYTHCDFSYWHVNDMVTTWIPLQDIPEALGGLAVRIGSHRGPPVPLTLLEVGDGDWATADYRAGDVLLFHCLTVHAALPNLKDTFRLSVDYRWVRADEPVSDQLVYGANHLLRGHPSAAQVPADAILVPDDVASRARPAPRQFAAHPAWATGPAAG